MTNQLFSGLPLVGSEEAPVCRSPAFAQPAAASGAATLVELLRIRASENPDGWAYSFLSDGEEESLRLTYAELDRRARALAARLQQIGAVGERALLVYPPGLDFVAAFFGCLYAGAVAVPSYPPRSGRPQPRLRSIVENARPRFALTTAALEPHWRSFAAEHAGAGEIEVLGTEELPEELAGEWAAPAIGGDTLAFLQYTSGSTADPKGVMVSHRNLLHNEAVICAACGHDASSTFVSWLPIYHDMGLIGGVLQPLYIGAPCILMSPVAFLQRPVRWLRAISRYRAHTSGAPNFAYDLCARKIKPEDRAGLDLSSWRVAFNGSEPVRAHSLETFAAAFADCGFRAETFFPCYGLAEATLLVSGAARNLPPVVRTFQGLEAHRALEGDTGEAAGRRLVSCGLLGDGLRVAIADPESGRERAAGEVGEIWVAGPSVAHGYWHRPEQTERTFRARLAGSDGPEFLRTGDLGFLHDGELFVTGRIKDLILVRGRNLYPQDVEATVAASHPALSGAGAAFAVETEEGEGVGIVQEVNPRWRGGWEEVLAAAVRAVAEEHEAATALLLLVKPGAVPRTTSGKIQRHLCRATALEGLFEPVAEWRRGPGDEAVAAPQAAEVDGGIESWLRGRVAARLGIAPERLDPEAPLTRYGLDSLAAVEIAHEVESALGVEVSLASLLADATLRQLVERLDTAARSPAEGTRPQPAARASGAEHPLTPGQRAIWFLERLSPGSPAYNVAGAARTGAGLEAGVLRRALRRLMDRHGALRATFHVHDGEPVQRLRPAAELDFGAEDATGWTPEELESRLAEEALRPFSLERGPLMRARLFRLESGEHALLLVFHHLIADFWSLAVLVDELRALYSAAPGEEPAGLAAAAPDYASWVHEAASADVPAEVEERWIYWRQRLSGGLPLLELPVDRPVPARRRHRAGTALLGVEPDVAAGLRALGRHHGATLFATLLAAFQALLCRYTGEDRILVGSPSLGRPRAALAGLVGYLVNPVPLLTDAGGDPDFVELLGRARRTAVEALGHEVPFSLLVERLQPQRDPRRPAVFPAMLALHRAPRTEDEGLAAFALGEAGERLHLGGLTLESVALAERPTPVDLTLLAAEVQGELRLALHYDLDLFDASTARRLMGHVEALLADVSLRPERRLSELALLSAAERAQVLVEWNDTDRERPSWEPVTDRVLARAQAAPGTAALVQGGRQVSYGELVRGAGRLAARLRALGIGAESKVAVLAERGPEMVIGQLGVLWAGAAYLPLDPELPQERLGLLVGDSGASAVLVQNGLAERVPPGVVAVRLEEALEGSAEPEMAPARLEPESLAYVIYTSGSTGMPKGVEVSHGALANLLDWHLASFGPRPGEAASQLAGLGFDASVWEIWTALAAGASLHLVDDEEVRRSPERLREWLVDQGIAVGFVPTALAEGLLALSWPDEGAPRVLLTGGERLAGRPASGLPFELRNNYGPTENAVVATSGAVAPQPAGRAPSIGRPIDGVRAYLLDRDLEPAAAGVVGELVLAGRSLARGYLGHPEWTAERFVPDGWSGEAGSRVYRTGDQARWLLPSGELEFVGRADGQVKVRGFRIEPGEIEQALLRQTGVREAAVLAPAGRGGSRRLVAYVALEPASASTGELRERLGRELPAYMVPADWVALASLPRTPNGKVDRRALAALEAGRARPEGAVAPRGPVEEMLAQAWAELLGVEQVGVEEDFFALGGHSLLAARAVARVRSLFGVELGVRELFERPTVAALAEAVEEALGAPARRRPEAMARIERGGDLPLGFAQQRLWFLERLQPGTAVYHVPLAVEIHGELSLPALSWALAEVCRRHEGLRSGFPEVEGRPVQRLGVAVESLPRLPRLPVVDLSGLSGPVRGAEASAVRRREARRGFDLERGPLLRACVLRQGESEHELVLVLHHLVCDGASVGVLLREVSALYAAGLEGRPGALPEPPVQPADYAVWEAERLVEARVTGQLDDWERRLAGLPALELATDRPRPAVQSLRGGVRTRPLAAERIAAVRQVARDQGATSFMVLMAAFQALLHRHSGQQDLAVGFPVANRGRAELEALVGLVVNTLVLRTEVAPERSFGELLGQVRQGTLEAFQHSGVPFEKVVERLRPDRALDRNPLFQAMLAFEPEAPELALTGARTVVEPLPTGTAKFDLTLWVRTAGEPLLAAEYSADLFDAPTIDRLLAHFDLLLADAAAWPERRPSELALLSVAERVQLLVEWNDTERKRPSWEPVPDRVLARAQAAPGAAALVLGGRRISYGELVRGAGRLAVRLRVLGIGAESKVAVLAERGPEMVIGQLGVLWAGAAYLPLDPELPQERLALLVGDSGASAVLVQDGLAERVPSGVVAVRLEEALEGSAAPEMAPARVEPESLAYVIYTSGSTGMPKGVEVSHGALANLLDWHLASFGPRPGEAASQLAGLGFDASVWEIWTALAAGASLHLADDEEVRRSPERLREWLVDRRIAVGFVPTALAEGLLALSWPDEGAPRVLLTGGERLAGRPAAGLPFELHNNYGPTENAVVATSGPVAPQPAGRAPSIGRPIANVRAYLLDRDLELVAAGVMGEMVLAGRSLARGYLGHPEWTAERFVPDGWSGEPGSRVYRTGDLARWLPSGELEFVGRADGQVKVRGFRIEPGEIEQALLRQAGAREAAVLAPTGRGGSQRLVAYVALEPGAVGGVAELRERLGRELPAYMVPADWMTLASLPRTPNGKVDRQALAALEAGRARPAGTVAPRGPVEEMLAQAWAELLGVDQMGVEEDFFALGGHSLLATRVVARVRSLFGVELGVRELFERPTVAALAEAVEEALGAPARRRPEALARIERGGDLPLGFAQQRLWFLERLQPGTAVYHVPLAVEIRGELSLPALSAALAEVCRRHEGLRSGFPEVEGHPVQRLGVAGESLPRLPVVDLSGLPGPVRGAEASAVRRHEARRGFDLERGPLLRACVLRQAESEHELVLVLHHLVCDGASVGVLLRELSALYAAGLEGRAGALPEPPVQPADYAAWEAQWLADEQVAGQLGYWERRLAGVPALELATDRPRPAVQSLRGGVRTSPLAAERIAAVRQVARDQGATPFIVLMAAFQALLHRHSGQQDLAVGFPVANRGRTELEALVGLLVNTLVLRTEVAPERSFSELLGRVRHGTLEAFQHAGVPFEKVVEKLRPDRTLDRNPLFQTMLAFEPEAPELALAGARTAVHPLPTGTAKFDLTLWVRTAGEPLVAAEYNADLFDAPTIDRLLEHFDLLLADVALRPVQPERGLWELALLSAAERAQLLVEWNDHDAGVPPAAGVHELFAAQARRAPGAPAIEWPGGVRSYGELAAAAWRVTERLRALGVGPEDVVGILTERSPDHCIAVLGTLGAGAAYAPLDPAWPRERIAFALRDAAMPVLLTHGRLAEGLETGGARVVSLDADLDTAPGDQGDAVVRFRSVDPAGLAYVIYTSGSTGVPKGVALTHAGLANLVHWHRAAYGIAERDRASHLSGLAFDASVWEIWPCLVSGACLHQASEEVRLSPAGLVSWLAERRISIAFVPTALAEPMLDEAWPRDASLRLLLTGGDRLRRRPGPEHPFILINHYGPTENTVVATCAPVAPEVARRPPPIGRPIAGVRAYVLGAGLEPAPLACPGEVCLSGAGLARGYLGRPDATAERFVPDPRGGPGGRLYRTGDLGRFLPDGSIEFLGRADAQVKIRGFRIEPGEIEAVLRGQPGVAEAVVEARTGPGGEARLVAWVAGPAERRPGDGELREAVRRALPAYMVPDLFVLLDGMPLSPNGKVDRHALPAPDWRRTGSGARVAPRSQVERMLAAIWAELLEIDEVGVFDNFFELGGHSLKAGRLVRRIQDTFGVEIPLRSLFEAPTVASLSVEIARQLVRRADPKALTRALNEVKSMGGKV